MKTHSKAWLVGMVLVLVAMGIMLRVSRTAGVAGLWYVAPGGGDDNLCTSPATACATINGAIAKASSGDTIYVAAGTYTGTGSEVVLLDRDATLSGGWDGDFIVQAGMSTIDGEGACKGIRVYNNVTAVIERFVVQNGFTSGRGGGIDNAGSLTLNSSTVSGNEARYDGGGIYNHGDDSSQRGTLTLNSSTVSGNEARYAGGGIYNYVLGYTLTLSNSTVSGNTARDGGGICNCGESGSGSPPVTLMINNSTLSNNTANEWGGGIFNGHVATLHSSTISGNTAAEGGGIDNYSFEDNSVTLENTILAGNVASENGPDCHYKEITSLGYNLIGDTSGCTFASTTGDLTNIDARLFSLTGSPEYHPLMTDSPAIDAGNPAGCTDSLGNPLPFDQRGMPRVGRCDIGAVEWHSLDTSSKTASVSAAPPDTSVTYLITLRNADDADVSGVVVTDTVPFWLTYDVDSLSATAGNYDYNNGVITWTGTISSDGVVDITFGATVSQTAPLGTSIANSAVISGGGAIFTRTATFSVGGPICNLTKHTGNPVLSIGAEGDWDDDAVWDPAVLQEESNYMMWYTGDDGANPSRIGLATSADGVSWQKHGSNPVLSPSQSWETKGIRVGSVISDSGLFKIWYSGYDSNWVARIGYATSLDGVAWTKHGSNPVLNVGAAGSWEDEDVMEPTVIKEGGIYHLWYRGYDGTANRIGRAISGDGITWTKDLTNPVLDVGSPGDWDWLSVYGPSAVKAGNGYVLWYSGGTLPPSWQTGYATSSNGSDWVRGKMLVPEGAPGAFDANSADYASVIMDGAEFEVWYSGHDGARYTIGHATAEICVAGAAPDNPIYLPIVMNNFDPQYPCPADYTDNFSDPDSGWPIDDNADRQYAYIDGQYQIMVKQPSQGWLATPGAQATDFTVAVSARRTSGMSGMYGIIFGINEDWSEYIEVLIDAFYYSIWRYDGSWTDLWGWTFSDHINTGSSWNRLKVIRDGANIAVYINDHHMTTVTDGSIVGLRRIGLAASSPSTGPLDARFDNFALYPVTCGASAAKVALLTAKPEIHRAPELPGGPRLPIKP